jgi:hypothetical protein
MDLLGVCGDICSVLLGRAALSPVAFSSFFFWTYSDGVRWNRSISSFSSFSSSSSLHHDRLFFVTYRQDRQGFSKKAEAP